MKGLQILSTQEVRQFFFVNPSMNLLLGKDDFIRMSVSRLEGTEVSVSCQKWGTPHVTFKLKGEQQKTRPHETLKWSKSKIVNLGPNLDPDKQVGDFLAS